MPKVTVRSGHEVSIGRIRLDTHLFALFDQSFQIVGQGQIGWPVRKIDLAPGGFDFGLQVFPGYDFLKVGRNRSGSKSTLVRVENRASR